MLPYPLNRTHMDRPTHQPKRHLELFPASLLKDRKRRDHISAHALPDSYLLVSALANPKQTMLVLRIGHDLKKRGVTVSVLSV